MCNQRIYADKSMHGYLIMRKPIYNYSKTNNPGTFKKKNAGLFFLAQIFIYFLWKTNFFLSIIAYSCLKIYLYVKIQTDEMRVLAMDKKEEIYNLLRNSGKRLTQQKKSILIILLGNMDRMLSVNDIINKIPEEKNIDNATVYRNVQDLAQLGILEAMIDDKGINRFVINQEGSHHHHLICVTCGKIFKIPCKNNYWSQYAKDENFEEIYHKLEVYGKCKKCKKSDADSLT